MVEKLFNENIVEQLRNGIAKFELVSSPVSSISTPSFSHALSTTFLADNSYRFFARIGPSLGGGSPATKKVEQYSVHKVTGDGRCLFRALVKGVTFKKGIALSPGKREMMQMNYEWLSKKFHVTVLKTGCSMKRLWLQLQLRNL